MAMAPGTTIADYLLPKRQSRSVNLLRDALLLIGFSVFTALCARFSFNLPFTPIPITLQTLAVLLTGAALGSKRGGLAMLLYLAEGAAGLPVFAPTPTSPGGFLALTFASVTGGYLWSFPVAAFVVGWLCERGLERKWLTALLAMLPGSVLIYLIGATWLAIVLHLDVAQAYKLGVAPFIPGDLCKLIVATLLLPAAWLLVRKVKREQE